MDDDLSTPLTGRRLKPGIKRHFPLTRVLFAVLALIALAFGLRVWLVNDPTGGRPSVEVAITSTHNANSVANQVSTGPVTITADPQQYPADAMPTEVLVSDNDMPDVSGILPSLSDPTADGPIPRIGATGLTPFAAYSAQSDPAQADLPKIAIIVSGLGINEQGSLEAINRLPGAVTLAFAPYGKTLANTVGMARNDGHEVLLEIPLEPFDYPQNDPGPQTLLTSETPRANLDKLFWLMARFGGYIGVINNMGARFTASAPDFAPIMEELSARGLGYVDDGSSNRSLAPQLAAQNKVPFSRVDLVIDNNPDRSAIEAALASLENQARANGQAVGIVSALPISIAVIAEWAQTLKERSIALVPASSLMQ